jgi:hypothetical protein
MTWRDGDVVLDQFAGTLDPVFEKLVRSDSLEGVQVRGVDAWWIDGPHDLTYVDREGDPVSETARLAGRTLIWAGGDGVSYRLEGTRLDADEAVAIARSLR